VAGSGRAACDDAHAVIDTAMAGRLSAIDLASVVPPHVEYSLTPLGEEIGKQVGSLADWIETNLPKIMKTQQKRLA
jgi:hypothetical protein